MKKTLGLLLATLLLMTAAFGQSNQRGGRTVASEYGAWQLQAYSSVTATSATMSVTKVGTYSTGQTVATVFTQNGRTILPIAVGVPLTVGSETVTPTAISCTSNVCSFTATFSSAHSAGELISSGSNGLAEAIFDLHSAGGGVVTIGRDWTGTNAQVAAAPEFPDIMIEDTRGLSTQFWYLGQAATTALATPATLTAVTALPSATPVGSYGTGTYHFCISYVDIMGNEGTCSADFSEAGLATGSFIFSAPAASTGAVGYTIYISLTGGTYALSYKVPLTSSICTLTTVETVTAACAVTNTNYGQTGATATVYGHHSQHGDAGTERDDHLDYGEYVRTRTRARCTTTFLRCKPGLPGVVSVLAGRSRLARLLRQRFLRSSAL
jgi:hypothetical protein